MIGLLLWILSPLSQLRRILAVIIIHVHKHNIRDASIIIVGALARLDTEFEIAFNYWFSKRFDEHENGQCFVSLCHFLKLDLCC